MPVERLAARAGLTLDDTMSGLAFLASPDPDSHSQDEDGRRIVALRENSQREWKLVNWEKYQQLANEESRREETRKRVAAWRERSAGNAHVTEPALRVTKSNALEVEVEATATEKNPPTRKRSVTPSFADDSQEMKAARYLFKKIRENNETAKEPNFQSWARAFDEIFRIDARDPRQVAAVIDFSQADEFWFKNILSPATLRKKFDALTVKMKTKPAAARPAATIERKEL